ncbi:pyridoxal-phosphate dependent enzyme [Frankia sp. AgKG'84/4]|uniref:pyridoxal-phosphate dependent enzyme n=1 Tax=Frankia sp. AgKG'84/4 TaxID=573490 RepID=UPI002010831E|nr:pyridoxal-phosphate dependent enzyme [Frankia sp. AgKG'84/4]MCL9793433.1 pyridoxal-phosphate dependent enzyme [Frankia sp. AgKG'84/4]
MPGHTLEHFGYLLDHFEPLLGNTPIKSIEVPIQGRSHRIDLKLEGYNITGSIKARTAYGLVRGLVDDGVLRPGGKLIESTSGNLGVALATLARYLDIEFLAVIDPLIASECRARLVDLGARIIMVDRPDPKGGYLLSRLAVVRDMLNRNEGYVWPDQYSSPRNPEIHRRLTGPEITAQLPVPPDAVFAAISTGGTFAGLSAHFREHSPSTKMIAVDIEGSIAYRGPAGRRFLPGIGASRRSSFLGSDLVDHFYSVSLRDSVRHCHQVLRNSGIYLGGSSGATIAACVRHLVENPDEIERPLCICPDDGGKYEQTVYSDDWLEKLRPDLESEAEIAGQTLVVP